MHSLCWDEAFRWTLDTGMLSLHEPSSGEGGYDWGIFSRSASADGRIVVGYREHSAQGGEATWYTPGVGLFRTGGRKRLDVPGDVECIHGM